MGRSPPYKGQLTYSTSGNAWLTDRTARSDQRRRASSPIVSLTTSWTKRWMAVRLVQPIIADQRESIQRLEKVVDDQGGYHQPWRAIPAEGDRAEKHLGL